MTRAAARHLGVSRRLAREDLEALEKHGVPLHPSGLNRERRWEIASSWRHHGAPVNLRDRLALLVGCELVDSFMRHTDVADALHELDRRIAALDSSAEVEGADLRRRFLFVHEPRKDYGAHRETVEALLNAILRCHPLTLQYSSAAGERREYRRIEPLSLIVYKRGLYLAFERRADFRMLAVERIHAVETHSDQGFSYPRPSEYDPSRRLAGRYGLFLDPDSPGPQRVTLRFHPTVRTFVEGREWDPGQRIDPRPDGGCDLVFEAAGTELASLALSFGDKVELIEPTWLRERVIAELRGALARYEAPDG